VVRIVVFAVIICGLVLGALLLPVKDYLVSLLEWTDGLGLWGPIVVAGFYVVACLLLLPGSVLTLGAGFLFGVATGTVTFSVGSTLGACAAFVVGRTVARDWIAQKISANPKFTAIDEAVARQGLKIVLLTRLSPIFPFNLLNYAFGLTKVDFRRYAIGSWVGMLPGTIMYVYLGSAARSLADVAAGNVEQQTTQRIFFWAGLLATVVVVVFVTRVARKALKQAAPGHAR